MATKKTTQKYDGKGDELSKELSRVQAELASAREGLGLAVARGGNAAELAAAISNLEAREAGLRAGLDIITGEVRAATEKERAELARQKVQETATRIEMNTAELLKQVRAIFDLADDIFKSGNKLPLPQNAMGVRLPLEEIGFAGNLVRILDPLLKSVEGAHMLTPTNSLLSRSGLGLHSGKTVPTKHDLLIFEATTALRNSEKLLALLKHAQSERFNVQKDQIEQAELRVQKCKERLAAVG
jgi:hypothetical protein